VSDVSGAFGWVEVIEQRSDASPGGFDGSLVGFAHESLEFRKHHLDRVEVWAVRRQEEHVRPSIPDSFAGRCAFVAAQIVEDDDIAWCEGGHQCLLDPGGEDAAIDGTLEHKRRDDPVVAQPGEEGQRLPMAMRDFCQVRQSARAPAMCPGHIGFDPGLVEENQAPWIKPPLMGLPSGSEPSQLRSILLLGQQSFF
jgi:hypothetical protein